MAGEPRSLAPQLLVEPLTCYRCGVISRNPAFFPKLKSVPIALRLPDNPVAPVCAKCICTWHQARKFGVSTPEELAAERAKKKAERSERKKAKAADAWRKKPAEPDVSGNPSRWIFKNAPVVTGRRLLPKKELISFKKDYGRGVAGCAWDQHISALYAMIGDDTTTVKVLDETIRDQAWAVRQITEFQKRLIENAAFLESYRAKNLAALQSLIDRRKKAQRDYSDAARTLSAGTSMHPLRIPDQLVETQRMMKLVTNTCHEE